MAKKITYKKHLQKFLTPWEHLTKKALDFAKNASIYWQNLEPYFGHFQ